MPVSSVFPDVSVTSTKIKGRENNTRKTVTQMALYVKSEYIFINSSFNTFLPITSSIE